MTAHIESAQAAVPNSAGTVLLVDDEVNILTSLKRLFRRTGFLVHTAESGMGGLALLEKEPVDVVISDMSMPHMNGAEFLSQVRSRNPDIIRILLTGHADMATTIEAINKGEIFRYLSKPWDDQEVMMIVRQAISTKRLIEEKRLLEAQVHLQNEELKALNANLEFKVQERTHALQETMRLLEAAHADLKKGFLTSIKVFSNLIEMREGSMAGHLRRAAELARSVALQMNMSHAEAQDVFIAALLHDIGKIGLPDGLLKKPYSLLNLEERTMMNSHAVKGQAALMALNQLSGAALLIRHHHERHDGQGYPDGLARQTIPVGARILAVVDSYDALMSGTRYPRKFTKEEALQDVVEHAGKSFDPAVVQAFVATMRKVPEKEAGSPANETPSSALLPGMRLERDLITPDGALLLAKDYVLNQVIINQIRDFEEAAGRPLQIYIA